MREFILRVDVEPWRTILGITKCAATELISIRILCGPVVYLDLYFLRSGNNCLGAIRSGPILESLATISQIIESLAGCVSSRGEDRPGKM